MNSRKERGIRRRYERIEGIVTQIFFLHEKTGNNLLGINSRVRGGIVYRIRDQRVRSEGKTSARRNVRRERYRHPLDLVVVDFSWCRKSRGRASISGSLSILFSFPPSFPLPPLCSSIIPRNTLLFSFSSMLDLLRLFTSCPRWKNFAWNGEKYGEMLDSKRKNRRKTKNCLDGGVSGIRTLVILVEN